jgi:hypothetical protein
LKIYNILSYDKEKQEFDHLPVNFFQAGISPGFMPGIDLSVDWTD